MPHRAFCIHLLALLKKLLILLNPSLGWSPTYPANIPSILCTDLFYPYHCDPNLTLFLHIVDLFFLINLVLPFPWLPGRVRTPSTFIFPSLLYTILAVLINHFVINIFIILTKIASVELNFSPDL